ncbi:MAG: hypothetical protein LBH71_02170 [Oscillospiraceae bacterium]|jgi:molybdopterin-biosynthesis enzyme MoeA-like protein|nr:hypothetical protein [Oscillospiraceae bacterium]
MVVKLMSLGLYISPDDIKMGNMIEETAAELFETNEKYVNYDNEKVFISELAKALDENDVIILSSQAEIFTSFKNFITKAFKLKKRLDRQIAKKLRTNIDPSQNEQEVLDEHAMIPVGGTPISSKDGYNSGFAIRSNDKMVFVIPFDADRLEDMLRGDFAVYSQMMAPIVERNKKNVEIEKVSETRAQEKLYDEQLIRDTVQKIEGKKIKIAVANTKTVDFIARISKDKINLENSLLITDYSCEKGSLPPRQYSIKLAKGAYDSAGGPLGASLSKVFTLKKEDESVEMFVYICISDKEKANAVKLFAGPGETPQQLIYAAIEDMFRMIGSWLETGDVIPPISKKALSEKEQKRKNLDENRDKKRLKIVVSACIAAAFAASVLVSALFAHPYEVPEMESESYSFYT